MPAEWQAASAPLVTRWAREVTPEHARPEYPRPQMVRRAWMNLNGLWEFAFDDHGNGRKTGWQSGTRLEGRILVPFTYEAALSGIGKGGEVHERVWYRRTFTVPRTWRRGEFQRGHVLLHFDAVDWQATVWVNDHELGTHRGGYAPFTVDITQALRPSGPQEVVVAVYDPADPQRGAYQPKGKQLGSRGIWYTRATGIWQTVWLEPVPRRHISSMDLDADPATGTLRATAYMDPEGAPVALLLTVLGSDGKPVGSAKSSVSVLSVPSRTVASNDTPAVHPDQDTLPGGREPILGQARMSASVVVPHVLLWTPETPNLYELRVELVSDGRVIDRVRSYTAFRKLGAANGRLTLNGQPYFYRGEFSHLLVQSVAAERPLTDAETCGNSPQVSKDGAYTVTSNTSCMSISGQCSLRSFPTSAS